MLRSVTELVPFGYDKDARRISALYLGNLGREYEGFNYLIAYYETPSMFSSDAGIRTYKFIINYDRYNSTFNMMQEIYKPEGWLNGTELMDHKLYNDYIADVACRLDERARKDLKWEF